MTLNSRTNRVSEKESQSLCGFSRNSKEGNSNSFLLISFLCFLVTLLMDFKISLFSASERPNAEHSRSPELFNCVKHFQLISPKSQALWIVAEKRIFRIASWLANFVRRSLEFLFVLYIERPEWFEQNQLEGNSFDKESFCLRILPEAIASAPKSIATLPTRMVHAVCADQTYTSAVGREGELLSNDKSHWFVWFLNF